jgi:putative ABC transport system substrate-binding protein
MRRRKFITLIGGAAAWPLAARAQRPAMPAVGYLYVGSPETGANQLAGFRKGLGEAGFVEGRNIAIEFRFAHNEPARLPELVADLVRRRVAVIAAIGVAPAIAAKAATTTIPVVIGIGGDPVEAGLVASLNRPGGNITGVSFMGEELGSKQLGFLHEMAPRAARFGVLLNPTTRSDTRRIPELQAAAAAIGWQIEVPTATTIDELDAAFVSLVDKGADALLVGSDGFFANRRVQFATLATHHRLPAIYPQREFPEIGGMMSYGANIPDQVRQAGLYAGRIVKGTNPADLPVMQPTKFELVINLHTVKTLGLSVHRGCSPSPTR